MSYLVKIKHNFLLNKRKEENATIPEKEKTATGMEWLARVLAQKGADQPILKLTAFHPPSMNQKGDEEQKHTEKPN